MSIAFAVLNRSSKAFLALGLLIVSTDSIAQDSSRYVSVVHPETARNSWRVFYAVADQLTADTRRVLPHRLDIAYGANSKQKLDVYVPTKRAHNAPVLIYVHGGNFVEGDRAHYGYVARAYAPRGIVTVVPSYRLTSAEHHYPDQPNDLKAVIQWVHTHIGTYGGDGDAIVVAGHSVGALMAAEVGLDRGWMVKAGLTPAILRGIVLVSGRYRADDGPIGDAFAPTPQARAAAAAIDHIAVPVPRVLIAYGTNEPLRIDAAQELAQRLSQHGVQARVLAVVGANHSDTALDIAIADSALFQGVLDLLKRSGNTAPQP